jgi:hypothetical protein
LLVLEASAVLLLEDNRQSAYTQMSFNGAGNPHQLNVAPVWPEISHAHVKKGGVSTAPDILHFIPVNH